MLIKNNLNAATRLRTESTRNDETPTQQHNSINHKNYNFLDCWFKQLLFSTNSLAKLLSDSLLLDSLLLDSLLSDSLLLDSLLSLLSDSSISQSHSKL